MAVTTNLPGATNFVLQEAISGYTDEAYTNAKKLTGTALIGSNPQIDVSTETFTGQIRWWKPLNPTINVASLTNENDGAYTSTSQQYLKYIKTVRTHGARQVNMQTIVTQQDGLAKISRDFAETRAQDEHDAILSVLKGVATAEAKAGILGNGGQGWNNDPTDPEYGFYVDLGAAKPVIAATAIAQGAARAEGFLQAIGAAWKDYEPDYAYLVVSPETYASIRSANLVDQTTVTEGNVVFNTIFNGKFRLIQTRANQTVDVSTLNSHADKQVPIVGQKTSFVVLPGALAFASLSVPLPVELERHAAKYAGGGTTEIWYRWGYVYAPAGYDWAGDDTKFVSNADYAAGTWGRKFTSALSLGILPIFHS